MASDEQLRELVAKWRKSAKAGRDIVEQTGRRHEFPSLVAASEQLACCADELEAALK